jgi:hypothetical protein
MAMTMVIAAETSAIPINIHTKDASGNPVILRINLDDNYQFLDASIQGKKVDVEKTAVKDFPMTLPGYDKKILDIRKGSIIQFEGSTCIPIPNGQGGYYWIGYPPGTRCP